MGFDFRRCGRHLLAWLMLPLACQASEGPGVERIRFFGLGMEQGLAQATARAIEQDLDGFLWIGSQDGLSRFDGHEFEVFRHRPGEVGGLGDNHITALAVDGEGALWIGTQAGGLSKRDPGDGLIRRQPGRGERPDGVGDPQITALLWDAWSGLWLAAGDGIIQRRTGDSWESPALGLSRAPGPVRSLRAAPDGSLLIAARHGAWRCPSASDCGEPLRDERGRPLDAYDLLVDADGSLWVGSTERGLYHFDASGALIERLHSGAAEGRRIGDDSIRRLLIDRGGRLWIANNNGVSSLAADRRLVRSWHHRPSAAGGLTASRIHTLFEDRSGLIWFGTWTEGLALLNPATEAFLSASADPTQPGALPADVVTALWADPDGSLWVGMAPNAGVAHFDLQRGVLAHYVHDPADPSSLSHNFVQHLARDRSGRLWVATQGGGLNRLREDGRGFDHFRHDPDDPGSLPSDHLLSVYADSEDTLWVGTLDSGLASLCRGCARFRHYRHDPSDPGSLGGHTINSCFEDSRGDFWVALRPGGLNRLDRASGRVTRHEAVAGDPAALSSNNVTALFEDSRHRLWVGTQGGGINLLQRDVDGRVSFRSVSRVQGLGSDAIGGLFEDRRGQLWASTTTGISRLDPDTWSLENFGGRDGVQASGYFVNSRTRLADGRLAFGGLRGITLFDPDALVQRRAPGQVALTRARSIGALDLAGDPVLLADQVRRSGRLHLRHPARDLTFEFSALALNAPEGLRYRHRLDGLEADWVEGDPRRRFAAYTNLPAGKYVFRVQALTSDLRGPETTIAVEVDPAPAAHPVVYAIYVAVGLSLLAVMGWLLLSRWRERERAADALRDSEERLKLALWGTGDELWDLDLRTDTMQRINPLPFLAAPRDPSARAADLVRFIHPDDRQLPIDCLRAHLRGETDIYEVTYRTLDTKGHWRWLRSRGRIVERNAEGRALRVAGTVSDVSELKRSQEELQILNAALEHRVSERTAELTRANETLQGTVADLKLAQRQLVDAEKMAALGGLVAGVAHEINTPLGISVTAASHLQGETERLRRLLQSGELKRSDIDTYEQHARESSELILRNLRRADKLVKSFKQVAVDQSSEERRHILLAQYIDEILTSLRPALKRSRHQIIVECPPELGFVTLPGAIYQILANLLMNSLIHAFEPDQPGEIRIEASLKPGLVLLTYADNGRGMSEQERSRIFEPFFTTRRGQGGSGLGMHIVFNLVTQALGGSIECDSAPGQGVYFSIRIPIEEGAPAA